jgi:hypothetical protein
MAGNQTLGRGRVYFSKFKPGGLYIPEGFRYLGNTPSFSLTISQEKLDHFSSDEGIRIKDKSIVLQTDFSGSLTMDDIDNDNLSLFFFGSKSTIAQTAATATEETFADVILGGRYQLGVTPQTPTGIRAISNVVVTKLPSTVLVVNTDYVIDAARGQVEFIAGGAVVSGDDIEVTYDRAARNRDQVISGSTQVEGALLFNSTNPQGKQIDFLMPYVRLGPNGDFALKTDEWQQLPVTVEILTAPARSAIYMDDQPYTPA